MIRRIQGLAGLGLLGALWATGCAHAGRVGRDETERIDAIMNRAGEAEEELAFAGLPPPATQPNATRGIVESTPSYEIRPDPRRISAARSSGRARKSSRR